MNKKKVNNLILLLGKEVSIGIICSWIVSEV
jgi:hypothetical protein